jgi:hypothetical protein
MFCQKEQENALPEKAEIPKIGNTEHFPEPST